MERAHKNYHYSAIKILGDNHKLILEKIKCRDENAKEVLIKRLNRSEGMYLVFHEKAPERVDSIQTHSVLDDIFANTPEVTSHRFTILKKRD